MWTTTPKKKKGGINVGSKFDDRDIFWTNNFQYLGSIIYEGGEIEEDVP